MNATDVNMLFSGMAVINGPMKNSSAEKRSSPSSPSRGSPRQRRRRGQGGRKPDRRGHVAADGAAVADLDVADLCRRFS